MHNLLLQWVTIWLYHSRWHPSCYALGMSLGKPRLSLVLMWCLIQCLQVPDQQKGLNIQTHTKMTEKNWSAMLILNLNKTTRLPHPNHTAVYKFLQAIFWTILISKSILSKIVPKWSQMPPKWRAYYFLIFSKWLPKILHGEDAIQPAW